MKIVPVMICLILILSGCDKLYSPEQSQKIILENEGQSYKVMLVYDKNLNEVILQINNSNIPILNDVSEEQIFNPQPSDEYTFQLSTNGNKIMVGSTYAFTNKYGSTSWINCFEYKDDQIKKIWSSDDILHHKFAVNSFTEESQTLEISMGQDLRRIILSDEETELWLDYVKFHQDGAQSLPELFFVINPAFTFYDYNNDGIEELITKTIISFEGCPISRAYFSAYQFSTDDIKQIEGWFRGTYPSIEQLDSLS
ncbi:hypothetical protein E0485_10775 [Paenibacillus albiflavus]|uniref:Uncharacterized protein n=1 Tax=Paenibacillus albiflavus TaxID=2545760 RepID=A0A4R4EDE4_9BACL|nr:hypothetical protein [Paenibacillus albiflavus]TCZ77467.1 hypothetical protein E0485_10775 [Paenibacillus albiflavus]